MRVLLCAAALAVCLTSQALAVFDLQITEIWPGNTTSANFTDDWFEVTNFGDMAWTSAAGTLFFDDSPPNPANAVPLFGVSSIAPGESVVYVDGNAGTGGLNEFLWHDGWDGPLTANLRPIPQVGSYEGAGLGQGGDGVALFLDSSPPVAAGDQIDFETYPDANASGGQSFDSFFDVFTELSFSGATVTGPNDDGEVSVGTPGYLLPEPASLALFGLGLTLVSLRRGRP